MDKQVFGAKAELRLILAGMDDNPTSDQIRAARGGKRSGSGRKQSRSKKIRISTSLAPDVVEYLNRRTDKPKSRIIEDALREHKLNFLNKHLTS